MKVEYTNNIKFVPYIYRYLAEKIRKKDKKKFLLELNN